MAPDPGDRRGLKSVGPLSLAAALALVLAGAAALRAWACGGDLWLDEIWSVEIARKVGSYPEIFTVARHDNNHFLNTIVLRAVGEPSRAFAYRVHTFLTGVGAVGLAAFLGWRRGRVESLTSAVLVGFSYVLINFSSEARGYGLAVFFTLLCLALLERHSETRGAWSASGFAIAASLGFLSHLTFLHAYVALGVLWLMRARRGAAWPWGLARDFLLCNGLPILTLAFLDVISLRDITRGGGVEPGYTQLDAVVDAMSLLVGGPVSWPPRLLGAALAVAATAFALASLWKRDRDLAIFFLTGLLASPLLVTPLLSPGFLFPRYFVVPISLGLLLLAWVGAEVLRTPGFTRWFGATIFLGMLAGNASHTFDLIRYGRGDFARAVRFIAARSAGREIFVSGDHPLRVGFVLSFYEREIPAGKKLVYVEPGSAPVGAAEWWIAHSMDPHREAPSALRDAAGHPYLLAETFRHGGISGTTWFLYRRGGG